MTDIGLDADTGRHWDDLIYSLDLCEVCGEPVRAIETCSVCKKDICMKCAVNIRSWHYLCPECAKFAEREE